MISFQPVPVVVLALWSALGGACVVHRVGHIEAADRSVQLVGGNGRAERLVLSAAASPLAALEGHLVDLQGYKALGAIRVGQWRVVEGPNGMAVWIGRVQPSKKGVAVVDSTTGDVLAVDPRTASQLAPLVGERVAIEGYVEGYARVAVVSWVALDVED
jgi:hypothetical protein